MAGDAIRALDDFGKSSLIKHVKFEKSPAFFTLYTRRNFTIGPGRAIVNAADIAVQHIVIQFKFLVQEYDIFPVFFSLQYHTKAYQAERT